MVQLSRVLPAKIVRALILGAPASGKGTISERLVKQFGFRHLACGDVLRQHQQLGTPLGREAAKYIGDGHLVPDELVTECILENVAAMPVGVSWLLDGFPRTIPQADALHTAHPVDMVLNLAVPHDVIVDRVRGRWVHLASGRVYNTGFNSPQQPGRDDVTGEPLSQRPDDQPETVRRRLAIYERYTRPLIEYYAKLGVLQTFEGSTTNAIWPKVLEHVQRRVELP